LTRGRLNRDAAAAFALLFVTLSALWMTSGGTTSPPTIDARLRQTIATPNDQLPAPNPLAIESWTLGVSSWDPFEFGGRPRIAEPQTFLYPPIVATPLSDKWLTLISYVLHVWLAGFAVCAIARRLNAGLVVALAVALGYMLSTALAVPAARVSAEVVFRAAWLPLLAAAILRSVERLSGPAQAGPHESGRPHELAGPYVVAIGLVIVGSGSPRTQAYGAIALIGSYLVAAAWTTGRWRRTAAQGLVAAGLIVAVGAPAVFPTIRLWRSTQRSGGLMSSEPFNGSWRADGTDRVAINPDLAAALQRLRPARVLTACPEAVDAVHLRALGVRSVGGYGGVYAADYAVFLNLVGNQTPTASLPYFGVPARQARADLLPFLDAEYVVSCEPAQGELVTGVDEVRIHRTAAAHGGAIWACYPNRVGRKELQYRLESRRYDRTLLLRELPPKINVRWAPDVDDAARVAAEARFHLVQDGAPDGRTRRYELLDPSRTNTEALVTDPAVEDTAGLDRLTLAPVKVPEVQFDERPTEWLIGLEPCSYEARGAANITRTDTGRITVDVDAPAEGVVLFSETYYRSRTALVDDQPASVMKVNLAFTAVPVPAGRHRVQLDAQPYTRGADWAVSGLALTGWVVAWWARRRITRGADPKGSRHEISEW
jgi:hypothetical protein